jgi:flagellar basal-body rod protein FlgG
MSGSIYMAATGALAYEKQLQLLSNNLANVNTAGFKKDRGRFREFELAETVNNKALPVQMGQPQATQYWMEYQGPFPGI